MNPESEGRIAAEKFREEHALGLTPLEDLVTLIDFTQGVDIAVLDVDRAEHGMTMRDPVRGISMIAVGRTGHPMRQRSTLAHELAHIVFGDFGPVKELGWDERTSEEKRADAFARHLLIPIDGVKAFLGHRVPDPSDLSMLVQRFQASPAIVAIQLEAAGYINGDLKREWLTETTPSLAVRFGWSDQYRVMQQESDTRRAPQRLLARAIDGYIANAVSIQAIARLRGVDVAEIEKEFSVAGIEPAAQETVWTSHEDLPPVVVDFGDLDAVEAAERRG